MCLPDKISDAFVLIFIFHLKLSYPVLNLIVQPRGIDLGVAFR